MVDRLKKQLSGDGTCISLWSGFRDPQLAASFARQPYDAIILDMQHGYHDEHTILPVILEIVSAGKSPLVRLPIRRWDLVERALDYGALGVIAPMINTAQDARDFARSMSYPPHGARSHGPAHVAALYGLDIPQYIALSGEMTFGLAMIETKQAYDNLDEILTVDGIDGILMGPSDFSVSVRNNALPDPYGPDTVNLVEDIAKRTRKAGKIAAAFAPRNDHSNLVHGMGYRLIAVSIDAKIVSNGAANELAGLDFV